MCLVGLFLEKSYIMNEINCAIACKSLFEAVNLSSEHNFSTNFYLRFQSTCIFDGQTKNEFWLVIIVLLPIRLLVIWLVALHTSVRMYQWWLDYASLCEMLSYVNIISEVCTTPVNSQIILWKDMKSNNQCSLLI